MDTIDGAGWPGIAAPARPSQQRLACGSTLHGEGTPLRQRRIRRRRRRGIRYAAGYLRQRTSGRWNPLAGSRGTLADDRPLRNRRRVLHHRRARLGRCDSREQRVEQRVGLLAAGAGQPDGARREPGRALRRGLFAGNYRWRLRLRNHQQWASRAGRQRPGRDHPGPRDGSARRHGGGNPRVWGPALCGRRSGASGLRYLDSPRTDPSGRTSGRAGSADRGQFFR